MIIYFTLHLILTLIATTLSKDLTLKNDPCAKFDTCHAKPELRTCSCSSDCSTYGTCCRNANKGRFFIPKSEFMCYHEHTTVPVFIKRSCAEDFHGHPDFIQDCFDDNLDEMDIKNSLLVTSHRTNISYWSSKCALCSNEAEDDLQFWDMKVFCPAKKGIDRSLILENLTFVEGQWSLNIGNESLQCVIKYIPPSSVDEVKYCTGNLISNCPVLYNNEDIIRKCSMHYAERKLKNSDQYYKNAYCAICNGFDITELECPGMTKPEDAVEETDFRDMVEEVFTREEWLEKRNSTRYRCSKGFIYSGFWGRCRKHVDQPMAEQAIFRNSSPALGTKYSVLLLALLTCLFRITL